jgi:hypothetical protein
MVIFNGLTIKVDNNKIIKWCKYYLRYHKN